MHVHEMVFGFVPAVITGFMLTAIPNWTHRSPIRGKELMVLFGLWLAGRLLSSSLLIPRIGYQPLYYPRRPTPSTASNSLSSGPEHEKKSIG
jgi:hypothetical protein